MSKIIITKDYENTCECGETVIVNPIIPIVYEGFVMKLSYDSNGVSAGICKCGNVFHTPC